MRDTLAIYLVLFGCLIWAQDTILPKEIFLEFELEGVGAVKLFLTKQGSLNDESLLVVTTDQAHWHPNHTQKVGTYEDVNNGATFSITYVEEKEQKIHKYFGSFLHENKAYSLKPADENVISEAISSYNVNLDGVDYVVSETKNEIKTENKVELKAVEKNVVSNKFVERVKRQAGNIKKSLTLELFLIIDYSIFNQWFLTSSRNSDKAVSNLIAYYAHIVAAIDAKYQTIISSRYSFTVRMTGIYFSKSQTDSFSENINIRRGNELDYHNGLNALTAWVDGKTTHIKNYDFIVAFTKYRSYETNTGLAWVSKSCNSGSVSISKDSGVYGTANVAAHELGHNLGSRHDGEGNLCRASNQYLMTDAFQDTAIKNHHTFSSCSVNAFVKYVDSLGIDHCLLSENSGIVVDTTDEIRLHLGTLYDLNAQCKHISGPNSYFCSLGIQSDTEACEKILCFDPILQNCIYNAGARALDGTPCGRNKWCMDKNCVYDSNAPTSKDECLNGDYFETINYNKVARTCADFRNLKGACKTDVVSNYCCQTCSDLKSSDPNCPFGDAFTNCQQLATFCIQSHIQQGCCETCGNVAKNNPVATFPILKRIAVKRVEYNN